MLNNIELLFFMLSHVEHLNHIEPCWLGCSRSSNVQGQGFKKCVDWASFGGYDRAVTL